MPFDPSPETAAPLPPVRVRDPVGSFLRLQGWLWVLIRHDALVPREITPQLPAWARLFAGVVHLVAGRQARN